MDLDNGTLRHASSEIEQKVRKIQTFKTLLLAGLTREFTNPRSECVSVRRLQHWIERPLFMDDNWIIGLLGCWIGGKTL